jgi:hypothetical protein
MNKISISAALAFVGLLFMGILSGDVLADGTETLGPPLGISIESGTGIVAAGTGLVSQPGTIVVNVPGAVSQVLLYWEGQMDTDAAGDATITVNGMPVTGSLIGGQTFFFSPDVYSSAFRADITSLGLVSAGSNTLNIAGVGFTKANNGAGVLVIYNDGSDVVDIAIRDGVDLAFINFAEPRKSTVPQTFTFDAASYSRTAHLSMFFSSVSGSVSGADADRPTSIEVTVDGIVTTFSNELASLDGEEWDTVNKSVVVPAGATSLTVQAFSRDDLSTGNLPASFAWIAAGLSIVPFEEDAGPGTGTPGYWKNHSEAWLVDEITIGGVTYTKAEAIAIMLDVGRGDKTHTMFSALVAAKLNVLMGNDDSCVADTIAEADAWMADHGPVGSGVRAGGRNSPWRDGEPLYFVLDDYNNGLLCAPHRD